MVVVNPVQEVAVQDVIQQVVQDAVTQQYRLEAVGIRHDEDFILKQKYGLVAPQLTGAEINIIRREARNAGL